MNQVISEKYALLISFRPNMTEEQFRIELQKAVRYALDLPVSREALHIATISKMETTEMKSKEEIINALAIKLTGSEFPISQIYILAMQEYATQQTDPLIKALKDLVKYMPQIGCDGMFGYSKTAYETAVELLKQHDNGNR